MELTKNQKIMLATGGILLVAWAANASNGASGGGGNNGGYTVSPVNEFQMLTDLIVDKYESKYVNDETEESKYVLTKKYYPQLDIKNLTKEIAYPIIKRDYWERIKATNFNSNIRFILFDTSINQGQPTAIKMIQRLGGVTQDGRVGAQTLAAAMTLTPEQIRDERISMYKELAKKPKYKKYLEGWVNRVNWIYDIQKKLNYDNY